jgi:hypothetical protein
MGRRNRSGFSRSRSKLCRLVGGFEAQRTSCAGAPAQDTDVIFAKACELGWGAIHCRRDGSIRVCGHPLTAANYATWGLSSSVTSGSRIQRVIVYTDHMPIIWAVESDCAKAYAYWAPPATASHFSGAVSVRFVPGTKNPTDSTSRGHELADAWSKILINALDFHTAVELDMNKDDGVSQPEWLPTARNPFGKL